MKTYHNYKHYFSYETFLLIESLNLSDEHLQPTDDSAALIADSLASDIGILKEFLMNLKQVELSGELRQKTQNQALIHLGYLEDVHSELTEETSNSSPADSSPQDMINLLGQTESSVDLLLSRLTPLLNQWERS